MKENKYEVHFCKECMRDVIDEEILFDLPMTDISFIIVPQEDCDNGDMDTYNERLYERNKAYLEKKQP